MDFEQEVRDIAAAATVNDKLQAWLQVNNRRRDQASIERFAAEKTKGNSEQFHGFDEDQLINAVGGLRPSS